jgi:predicted nuclease with TOPRIM domain
MFPACAPRQAQNARLFREWNAKCKEAADLLTTVKDVQSAKAVAPRLSALMKRLDEINEKLDQTCDPEEAALDDSPRTVKQLAEGIGEMQRLTMESVRIGQDPEIRAALGEAWQLLPAAAMMEAGVEFPPVESPAAP